jgi:hypothetical protein
MGPEGWAFLTATVGSVVALLTTQIVQNNTTRRAMLERQQVTDAKAETAARTALRGAEAAELAAVNSRPISNGTVPKILRHLEDQGGMLVRLTTQVDQLAQAGGRTVQRLDQTAGAVMDHLADHARGYAREVRE